MKRAFVAISFTMVAMMGSAQAAPTTFTFSASDYDKTSILKSLDGINLTIGNFLNAGPKSYADNDGFALFNGPGFDSNNYNTFYMTFDQPVKLISYNIKYLAYIGSTPPTTTTYSQNMFQSVETYTQYLGLSFFNNQFIAQANTPISVVTANLHPRGVAQINALTVEKVDPVPGPLPLAGAAAAFSWSCRLRSRIRSTVCV